MQIENIVLIVHLLLALGIIAAVLLQRSEGGGLGIGGGGGTATGRAPQSALGKVTWGLAIAFICTSIALTIIAAENSAGASVLDRITDAPAPEAPAPADLGDNLLPPAPGTAEPLVPAGE